MLQCMKTLCLVMTDLFLLLMNTVRMIEMTGILKLEIRLSRLNTSHCNPCPFHDRGIVGNSKARLDGEFMGKTGRVRT